VQHCHIISDVANGLDLTAERRTEQHAAKQLVVGLHHLPAPARPRSVKGHVITISGEAGTVRRRITIGPRLAHPLKQGLQLLIISQPDTLTCAGCVIGHISSYSGRPGPVWHLPAAALPSCTQFLTLI